MAKATVNETPTAELIKAAQTEVVVQDSRGREIKLKKPGVLAQYRLVEALGSLAKNEVYTGMVMPLIFVTEIAGDPIFQPTTKLEIEALLVRLDEDGLSAVLTGVEEHFSNRDPEQDKDSLKKS